LNLIYFTNSFPYGYGENWKYIELEKLSKYFDSIYVAPLTYNGNSSARNVPTKVKVIKPTLKSDSLKTTLKDAIWFSLINPKILLRVLIELNRIKSIRDIKKLLVDAMKVGRILHSSSYKDFVEPLLDGSLLYFFWGKGYADILPFIKHHQRRCVAIRVHGFDLYLDRNQGYIPFQKQILDNANRILTVSSHGSDYLLKLYPDLFNRILVSILGTQKFGDVNYSTDDILRIVSCSYINPIKRVNLIVAALQEIKDLEIHWTHIGGGEKLNYIKSLSKINGKNIKATFKGSLTNNQIGRLYSTGIYDLFINVSSSEGLPVSIMEAMAHGIPIIATDVGGTREIVNEKNGKLLPKDITSSNLAGEIIKFAQLEKAVRVNMGQACIQTYYSKLNANDNACTLAESLKKLEYECS
jgi:glycosyltransferase involved in cell wall biosynthesis